MKIVSVKVTMQQKLRGAEKSARNPKNVKDIGSKKMLMGLLAIWLPHLFVHKAATNIHLETKGQY